MIEEFSYTKKMENEAYASLTWARKTWRQRLLENPKLHAQQIILPYSTVYVVTPINALFRRPIKVKTLCQMSFSTLACGTERQDNYYPLTMKYNPKNKNNF